MKRPIRIAPSILAADFGRLAAEVRAVEGAGADWIHVDVMDGHFVPNLTIGPPVVKALRRATTLPLDVHLMIEEPERSLAEYAARGRRPHRRPRRDLPAPAPHARSRSARLGKQACVVLNPATPVAAVEPVLGELDQVLVMSVNPGFGGQSFIEGVLPKLAQLRRWIDERELAVELEVDGGITPDTIERAARAGANVFVAGTAVFGASDYAAAIADLRKRAEG